MGASHSIYLGQHSVLTTCMDKTDMAASLPPVTSHMLCFGNCCNDLGIAAVELSTMPLLSATQAREQQEGAAKLQKRRAGVAIDFSQITPDGTGLDVCQPAAYGCRLLPYSSIWLYSMQQLWWGQQQ